MTTFTTEDREEAEKNPQPFTELGKALDKLVNSYTMYIGEPIPFFGWFKDDE